MTNEDLRSLLKRSDQLVKKQYYQKAVKMGPQIIGEYYRQVEGRDLNIEVHPSFSAKIHQRMVDFHTKGADKATLIADKLAVKHYVESCVGEEYIPKVIWQGNSLTDDILLDIPRNGILKCNEGCGKNILLNERQGFDVIKKVAHKWLNESYYWFRREYQYYKIPRKIFVEEIINDGHTDGPLDYIFYCFDGKVELIQTGSRSHIIHSFFTTSWQQLSLTYRKDYEAPTIARPSQLGHMLEVAQEISKGFDFVRVDLYQAGEKVLFGEMTLTPRAGEIQFIPSEWNMRLGDFWDYRYNL